LLLFCPIYPAGCKFYPFVLRLCCVGEVRGSVGIGQRPVCTPAVSS
jgi:hypothetical protein